jgi:hypothetical protein
MPAVLSKFVETIDIALAFARYNFGGCYFNANMNRKTVFKGMNLTPVYGSLGLNGHFEYGGRNHTVRDFAENPMDSHCWLEDEEGNVYDFIFEEYADIAQRWTGSCTFPENFHIQGWTKQDLKELYNIEYVAAPIKAQRDIVKNARAIQQAYWSHSDVSAKLCPLYCP